MSLLARAGSVGLKAAIHSNPITNLASTVGSEISTLASGVGKALGIDTCSDKKYTERQATARRVRDLARQGDRQALDVLGAIGRRHGLYKAVPAGTVYSSGGPLPRGWTSIKWGKCYNRIVERAGKQWDEINQLGPEGEDAPSSDDNEPLPQTDEEDTTWQDSSGTAPESPRKKSTGKGAAGSSSPSRKRKSAGSAPSAEKPPCKYGPRDSDGRCPKKPSIRSLTGSAGRPAGRPCAYGPRQADGYCPKKPRANRARAAAQRKLEQAGEKVAVDVTKAVIKAAGGPMAAVKFAAKYTLVGLAGLAAYYITSKLRTLRFKSWADLKFELSNQYRHKRMEAAKDAGRDLTPEELASYSQWYKAQIHRYDELAAQGVRVTHLKFDEDV